MSVRGLSLSNNGRWTVQHIHGKHLDFVGELSVRFCALKHLGDHWENLLIHVIDMIFWNHCVNQIRMTSNYMMTIMITIIEFGFPVLFYLPNVWQFCLTSTRSDKSLLSLESNNSALKKERHSSMFQLMMRSCRLRLTYMSKSTYCGDAWTNCLEVCIYAPIVILGMSYIKGDEESLYKLLIHVMLS